MFLGITINNKLKWNSHINKVTNKISKTVGILNKLRSFLPSGVLQTIYNTLILPHLIYGVHINLCNVFIYCTKQLNHHLYISLLSLICMYYITIWWLPC